VIRLCTVVPVLILALVSVRQAHAQSCMGAFECDDQNDCTTDTCDQGTCSHTAVEAQSCDDGDPCTVGDRCANGTCAGVPLDCDDGKACTDDSCDDGTCVHDPVDDRCPGSSECVQTQCQPDGPGADARGCVADSASFELSACSEDQNPCTVDQCHAGTCTHDPVDDPTGCSPVVPSYQHAIELRAGVERLLVYMDDEVQVGGNTSGRLDDDLAAVAADLDGTASVLAGRTPDSGQPQAARPIPGFRLAADTIAEQRGRVALLWVRAAPAHVLDFLAAVSSGRRHGDVTPDAARELRRNGRILLAGTKALKRDVKNLQKTFSVFQR
jgi:hypothetical protein